MEKNKMESFQDGSKKQKRAGKHMRHIPGYNDSSRDGTVNAAATSQEQQATMSVDYDDATAPAASWTAETVIRTTTDFESDVSDADDDEAELAYVKESVEHCFRNSTTAKILGIMRSDPPQTRGSTFPAASMLARYTGDEEGWYERENNRLRYEKRELVKALEDMKLKYWASEATNKKLRMELDEVKMSIG